MTTTRGLEVVAECMTSLSALVRLIARLPQLSDSEFGWAPLAAQRGRARTKGHHAAFTALPLGSGSAFSTPSQKGVQTSAIPGSR